MQSALSNLEFLQNPNDKIKIGEALLTVVLSTEHLGVANLQRHKKMQIMEVNQSLKSFWVSKVTVSLSTLND